MNDEIKKNPRSAESNLIRKRVAGVEREIERMTGIIKALTEEEAWFQDTIERFREGGAKTEAAIAQATADAETARQRLAEVLAQQGGGQEPPAAPAQPAPEGIIGVVGAKNVVAMNLVVFLIMLAMTLATGREYSLMRWANQPVRRAYFVNTMDKVAISLRVPSYELLWEFVAVVALGLGFKWTP
ncbi:hypothetical protein F4781DRAFT_295739 [Annulohypoxylon bovei var. microspora]|nr:hypothetical protein F4781DRAFT_295739 [Annulohypoxylon bovei var. microspora]